MRNWLYKQFTRKEWTANVADPTQVVQWKTRQGHITLIASWGVEAKVSVWSHTWRTYDLGLFVRLFDWLEDQHTQRKVDADEYGYLRYYE